MTTKPGSLTRPRDCITPRLPSALPNWICATAILFVALFMPLLARAACSTPTGAEGEIIYNSDYAVVQYCDGTNWISMASSGSLSEFDPEVGSLTASNWCKANASGTAIVCSSSAISLATDVTGTLQAAQFPALTGVVTTTAGSLTTTITTGAVTNAMLAGSIDLTAKVTGILPVANGGTGTATGSITGTGALTFAAGGTNQNVTLTPSGTGYTLLNGNVGIGTTTPGSLLHINGNNAELRLSEIGTYYGSISTDSVGTVRISSDPSNLVANSRVLFFVDGSEKARIDSSGNLGIGTNAPATILDVNGAFTQRGMAAPSVSTAGQGIIYFDSTANKFKVSQNGGAYADLVGTSITADSLDFTDLSDTMTIDAATAITWAGTTTNGLTLNANSLTTGSALVVATNATTTYSGDLASFTSSGNATGVTGSVVKVGMTGATAAGTALNITNAGTGTALRVNDDGTYTDTTPFIIDASGNVGIGTATPGASLTVNSSSSGYSLLSQSTPTISANSTNYTFGGSLRVEKVVDTGVTDSGYAMGTEAVGYLNGPGTLAAAYGIRAYGGTYLSGTGIVTTAYGGVFGVVNQGAGTITTGYGVYIGGVAGTSKFGLYQSDATNKNFFAGNVGIGTIAPGTILDVNGAFTQRGMAAPSVSPAGQGIIYFDSTANKFKVSQNGGAYADLVGGGASALSALTDVTITSAANNDILQYDSGTSKWVNTQITSAISGVAGPTFSVNNGATTQTVTSSTWTKVTWNAEELDSNNNFDLTTDKFTPTVAGKYLFHFNTLCQSATPICYAGIYKNGVSVSVSYNRANGSDMAQATAILDMNGTTDYVEAYAYSGGTIIGGAAIYHLFQGSMLAPLASGTVAGTGTSGYIPVWTSGNALTNAAALVYLSSGNLLTVTALAATDKPFIVEGAASQSANLQEWQNSSATALATVSSSGIITAPALVPSGSTIATNGLYLPAASTPAISANSVDVVRFNTAASAVNYFTLTPSAGTSTVTLASAGTGATVPITIDAKGTSSIVLSDAVTASSTLSVTGAITASSTITGASATIGLGTTSVAATALLDMVSTTKGFLPPRMTTTQRDAISTPAEGLTIYNTTTDALNVYSGTAWGAVGAGASALSGLTDVTITSVANSDILQYDTGTSKWVNTPLVSAVAGAAGPSFSVHRNGVDQTVTATTWTTANFTTEAFDTNNNFDITTDRFTPTVAGKYILEASTYCADATTACSVMILKNGVSYSQGWDNNGGVAFANTSAVVDMNGSTDYVEVQVYDGGGTTISGLTYRTFFQGSMLAPLASGTVAGTGTAGKMPVWTSGNALTNATAMDYTGAGSLLTITAQAATDKPLIVKGAASQSGNLQEWQNSSGTALAVVNASGNVGIGTSTINANAKLDVAGAIRVAGSGSETCAAGSVGAMRYNSTGGYMELCQ